MNTKSTLRQASFEFARPADTTAYSENDVIFMSAAGSMEFAQLLPTDGGSAVLVSASLQLNLSSAPAGLAAVRLHLFSAAPPAVTDNSAFSRSDNDWQNYLGFVEFNDWQDHGNVIYSQATDTVILLSSLADDDKASVFGLLETVSAFTPASAMKVRVTLSAGL